MCNLGRGHYEKHDYVIVLNFDKWLKRRCRLKIFLTYSSEGHFAHRSGTIWAILVEGTMRNISVEYDEHSCEIILNQMSLKIFLLLFSMLGAEPFVQFW